MPRQERYVVQNEIASGGMGAVYRVRDNVTGELLALKRVLVLNDGSARRHAIEALEREYQVLSSLDHPRIIRVLDYGVDASGPFYTMELLEGDDLRRVAPLPFQVACMYTRDVATSLALLHGRRLLHRDLSPSNVRVTADGHCKLLDFGALVAFGVAPHLVGTPPLVAPEAIGGLPLDQRTDLYALGALAYWMLTGRHAYPARELSELPAQWDLPLAPPSSFAASVPRELDALVLALLNRDPLARPGSAAEVITRLDAIAELPPENSTQTERLAQSFFITPRFTGRKAAMRELNACTDAAMGGNGSALRIEAAPGMGRTRLLEEAVMRARLAGATVLFADASMTRQLQGTARALVARVFELLPELANECSADFRSTLPALGQQDEWPAGRTGVDSPAARQSLHPNVGPPRPLAEFFAEISKHRPLVIAVDNIEEIDDASCGLLASLASLAESHALLVLVTESLQRDRAAPSIGSIALRRHSRTLELTGLSQNEMLELVRSIFADAPSVERLAEWLHERTAGSPLHAVEICRRLLAKGVIRYANGLWTLPVERPEAELPAALADALWIRLNSLSEPARALAECLSLQRDQPTLELCTLLCDRDAEPSARARALLDELARAHVLQASANGFRFSSSALRAALLQNMNAERLEHNHRRLGEVFARLASDDQLALRIEAGFHLLEGGDELRGAETIASATHDSARFSTLVANLFHAGRPVEAAYKVYHQQRRSAYERMPLLAAMAQAGYYEDRYFADEYGDDALDVLDMLGGVDVMRRLRCYVGKVLAFVIGVLLAWLRFRLTPRSERPYTFREVYTQLLSTVVTLVGTAALSLDAARASRIAQQLEPFAFLPERLTPVGIYQFCVSLAEVGRENEVEASATFERLLKRFSDTRYYPALPAQRRNLVVAGLHFARGSFALFRANGESTLESANALDATGLKLYAMIASQLRFLYYSARGEFSRAESHRRQVELHAAHVGSVWQVETWEAAALLAIHGIAVGEVVGATRALHRLEAVSRNVSSLKRYSRMASVSLISVNHDKRYLQEFCARHADDKPRSYIGWAATQSSVVRSYNQIGEFAEAKAQGERALAHVTEADRDYVMLFLPLDIQVAFANAGLGDVDAGLASIDRLIARFAGCDHPLLQGMLHEARAYICWDAKRLDEYEQSVSAVEFWYRSTGTPALIAKYERLRAVSKIAKAQQSLLPAPKTQAAVSDRGSPQTGEDNGPTLTERGRTK